MKLLLGSILLAGLTANAQTVTLTTNANDPRPVDTIIRQIEKLSGIPIHYEDLLYSILPIQWTSVLRSRGAAEPVPI
jgi:hypothetical protein